MRKIEKLVNLLNGHKVYIQTHDFPDPDAIASAYGLSELLDDFGIKSKIIYSGSLNNMSCLRMIDYFRIKMYNTQELNIKENDYIVLVDAQKYNKNCEDVPGIEVACIDHHPTFVECEYEYRDIRMVGACASIIADYYHDAKLDPSISVASALLYGIKMDTADFGRGVSELDVKVYYKLFPYSDKKLLEKMQLNNIEFADLKAYGAAINNVSVYKNIGFACLPFDCPDGLVAIISDFMLALDVVEFCIVYSIRPEGYKFSVRSEISKFDAGKVIANVTKKIGFGSGGGHAFMAGGFIPNEGVQKLRTNPRRVLEKMFIKELYPKDTVTAKDIIRN